MRFTAGAGAHQGQPPLHAAGVEGDALVPHATGEEVHAAQRRLHCIPQLIPLRSTAGPYQKLFIESFYDIDLLSLVIQSSAAQHLISTKNKGMKT